VTVPVGVVADVIADVVADVGVPGSEKVRVIGWPAGAVVPGATLSVRGVLKALTVSATEVDVVA
jgi:hypothetical protein